VVQDFRFSWSLPNPMVHYKIYNKSVDLPFWKSISRLFDFGVC
jgi:hypothetical protein